MPLLEFFDIPQDTLILVGGLDFSEGLSLYG